MSNLSKKLSSKLNTSYYMISSLKNVTISYVLRTMYFACFHVHLRYLKEDWSTFYCNTFSIQWMNICPLRFHCYSITYYYYEHFILSIS